MKKIFTLLLLSLPLFSSLIRPGFYNMQDSMQPFRFYEMWRCFADAQLPCRWVPDMGYGFGYPLYIFYAPGPYYLGAALHLISISFVDATKIIIILGFLTSALGMYLLSKLTFSSTKASYISTLLYLYAPVRAVQVYVRGSLGEFLALAVFPFLFYFSLRLIKSQRWRDCGLFAIALAVMFLTHNLMSYAILPLLAIWIVFHLISVKTLKCLPKIIISLVLGFCLAGFFLIPLLAENSLVHLETLIGGYFGYRQHFVSLSQLFFSNTWGYGSSGLNAGPDLALSVGPIHWLVSLFAAILAVINSRRHPKLSSLILLLSLLEVGVLFLTHRRSTFIWEAFPFLAYFQFPWRLLVISTFLTSLLSGSIYQYLSSARIFRYFPITVTLALLLLHGGFFQPQHWIKYADADMFTPAEFKRLQTISIFDYLPKVVPTPPKSAAPSRPEIISGQAIINFYSKGSNIHIGHVSVTSPQAEIRLPLFDYYGMRVQANHQTVSHHQTDGLIEFTLPKGDYSLEAKLTSTPDRLAGDMLSLLSLVITVLLIL